MAFCSVEWRHSAVKDLRSLAKEEVGRIISAVAELAEEPRPHGCRKLQGADHNYRIRIGDYRVVYEIQDKVRIVLIQRVRRRKDVYRD